MCIRDRLSWSLVFYGLAGLFIGLSVYHKLVLPNVERKAEHKSLSVSYLFSEFVSTFVSFFKKKQILTAIAFMLLFRLPEALLNPIGPLFLRADISKGGLALSLESFGLVNGIVGVVGLLGGGILGAVSYTHLRAHET